MCERTNERFLLSSFGQSQLFFCPACFFVGLRANEAATCFSDGVALTGEMMFCSHGEMEREFQFHKDILEQCNNTHSSCRF